jgi:hypothetical protein
MPRKTINPHSEHFLIGWDNIGQALGISKSTAMRWAKAEGLPVAPLPDGHVGTSIMLISMWMLSRVPDRKASAVYPPTSRVPSQKKSQNNAEPQ